MVDVGVGRGLGVFESGSGSVMFVCSFMKDDSVLGGRLIWGSSP